MKVALIFICILLSTISVLSQNIVRNGGFERYSNFPPFLLNLKSWYKPTMASTDLHKEYFVWNGQITKPYSGNAFIGMIVHDINYEYAEYATNRLDSKLKKDSLYCLRMHVLLSTATSYAPKSLDIYMSKKRIRRWTRKPISKYYHASFSINGNSYLSNRGFWEEYCAVYRSKGDEKYMSLGFFSENFDYIQIFDTPKKDYGHCYLMIDDVTLYLISDSSQCDCNRRRTDFNSINTNKEADTAFHAPVLKVGQIVKFNDLNFANSSFEIDSSAYHELDRLYQILVEDTAIAIQINGHTDSKGPDRVNNRLSTNRAKAVANYLINKGIDRNRVNYKGFGAHFPIATNATEAGRKENRRVEFEVIEK